MIRHLGEGQKRRKPGNTKRERFLGGFPIVERQNLFKPQSPNRINGRTAIDRDVCPHKSQEQNDRKRHSAGIEIRHNQRSPNHQKVQKQPNTEQKATCKKPEITPMRSVHRQEQQPRRQKQQPDQVEVSHAPEAVELVKNGENDHRRQIKPCRWDHFVLKQGGWHSRNL